jgi:hypothetical protein
MAQHQDLRTEQGVVATNPVIVLKGEMLPAISKTLKYVEGETQKMLGGLTGIAGGGGEIDQLKSQLKHAAATASASLNALTQETQHVGHDPAGLDQMANLKKRLMAHLGEFKGALASVEAHVTTIYAAKREVGTLRFEMNESLSQANKKSEAAEQRLSEMVERGDVTLPDSNRILIEYESSLSKVIEASEEAHMAADAVGGRPEDLERAKTAFNLVNERVVQLQNTIDKFESQHAGATKSHHAEAMHIKALLPTAHDEMPPELKIDQLIATFPSVPTGVPAEMLREMLPSVPKNDPIELQVSDLNNWDNYETNNLSDTDRDAVKKYSLAMNKDLWHLGLNIRETENQFISLSGGETIANKAHSELVADLYHVFEDVMESKVRMDVLIKKGAEIGISDPAEFQAGVAEVKGRIKDLNKLISTACSVAEAYKSLNGGAHLSEASSSVKNSDSVAS